MKLTMTTYDCLNNAEQQLRDALKTTVDKGDSYQLKRIAEVIDTVSQIKSRFKPTNSFTLNVGKNFEDYYGGYHAAESVAFGDFIVGSAGTDTITFG